MQLDRKLFPRLAKAVVLSTGDPRLNLCIHRSAALVLDVVDLQLVFATFMPDPNEPPPASQVPFIHAFTQTIDGKWIISPTRLELDGKLQRIEKQFYYTLHRARDEHILPRPAVKRVAKRIRFDRALAGKDGSESIGAAFLDAAGVPWMDDSTGGIVPRGILRHG